MALLANIQVSHVQLPAAGLNLSPNPNEGAAAASEGAELIEFTGAAEVAPGFGVSHAAHFVTSPLFCNMHVSHSHEPAAGLNWLPKPLLVNGGLLLADDKEFNGFVTPLCCPPNRLEGGLLVVVADPPGLGVVQHAHLLSSGLLSAIQESQDHVPAVFLNKRPRGALLVLLVDPDETYRELKTLKKKLVPKKPVMESRPHHPRPRPKPRPHHLRPGHLRPRPPLPRPRPFKSETETETQYFSCQIFLYTKNIILSLGIFFYTKNIIFSLGI